MFTLNLSQFMCYQKLLTTTIQYYNCYNDYKRHIMYLYDSNILRNSSNMLSHYTSICNSSVLPYHVTYKPDINHPWRQIMTPPPLDPHLLPNRQSKKILYDSIPHFPHCFSRWTLNFIIYRFKTLSVHKSSS